MNRLKIIIAICVLALSANNPLSAQPYSLNVVGYYNLGLSAGNHLIANQLYATNNSINTVLAAAPNGSTLAKWNSTTLQYQPTSVFNTETGWSINYDLNPGEGALFYTPTAFTNTFVGEVPYDFGNDTPIFTFPTPADGLFLLSCSVPLNGATFQQVIGRNPLEGESVTRLDSFSQNYLTTIYRSDGWDNGTPLLGLGEAGFFALGPDALTLVPEPGTYALLSLGLATLGLRYKFRSKSNTQV